VRRTAPTVDAHPLPANHEREMRPAGSRIDIELGFEICSLAYNIC
jgi:hypothetical protein